MTPISTSYNTKCDLSVLRPAVKSQAAFIESLSIKIIKASLLSTDAETDHREKNRKPGRKEEICCC